MTAPAGADDTPHFAYDARVVSAFARLTGGFWAGASARMAWFWTLGLIASLTATVGVNVAVNTWNGWFFNALEDKDAQAAWQAALVFAGLVVLVAAVGVLTVITRETLQVRWREWVTARLMSLWFERQRYYHLGLNGIEPANPEYRIADDTRMALEPIVDFAIGLVSATLGALTFIGLLWSIGGSYTLGSVTIPAYLVLAALLHGLLASGLIFTIGRSLMRKVAARNEAEAKLRFGLMRVRENAPAIALDRGEADEAQRLGSIYALLVRRWLAVVRMNGQLTWIMNGNAALNPVVPLLLAAPKYLEGDLSLGQVTQIAAAYVQVQIAISWFVDNYRRVAECYASVRRVIDLTDALDLLAVEEGNRGGRAITRTDSDSATIRLEGLAVADKAGRRLVRSIDATITPGTWLLVAGESGSGKSLLVRALAGLWPWGEGQVHMPSRARLMILPQRLYLPQGALRQVLTYPHDRAEAIDAQDAAWSRADLAAILGHCGLGHLAPRLDEDDLWDRVLSDSERQRLGVARALVHRPDILVLDDAASAIEPAVERHLLALLKAELPGATVLTVARRTAAEDLHDTVWTLRRGPDGAVIDRPETPPPVRPARKRRAAAPAT